MATAPDIVIREARDADGDGLIALIEPIFLEYDGVLFLIEEMPELRHIASSFEEVGGQFWCAERPDLQPASGLLGCVGWAPARDQAGAPGVELKKLYVARSERRHGLGGRLAARVEQAARGRGARYVELWSDVKFTSAHAFYERRGYQRTGDQRALHDASDTREYYFRLPLSD